ncbi:protein boule-like [Rhopilema esculentum]|uniref:protein boule-like n=1 Tax=Rhopilema esculentum TaxID=499914 RepID=UPI0031D71C2F
MASVQAIRIQVPIGIPTSDGGLEIPNRIFLGGIPPDTTELELEVFFSDFGTVKDVRIVTDRKTGECKGYGFVTFETPEDISNLLKKKSIIMKGKRLRIRKAVRRNGSQFQASPTGSNTAEPPLSPVKPNAIIPQKSPPVEPYVLVPVSVEPSQCMSCNLMAYPPAQNVCQPVCYMNPGLVPVQQYNWPIYQR